MKIKSAVILGFVLCSPFAFGQACLDLVNDLRHYQQTVKVQDAEMIQKFDHLSQVLNQWSSQWVPLEGQKILDESFAPVQEYSQSVQAWSHQTLQQTQWASEEVFDLLDSHYGCIESNESLFQWEEEVYNYNDLTRGHGESLASALSMLASLLEGWYKKWNRWVGGTIPVPIGAFDKLQSENQRVQVATRLLFETLKTLQKILDDLITKLDGLTKAGEVAPEGKISSKLTSKR